MAAIPVGGCAAVAGAGSCATAAGAGAGGWAWSGQVIGPARMGWPSTRIGACRHEYGGRHSGQARPGPNGDSRYRNIQCLGHTLNNPAVLDENNELHKYTNDDRPPYAGNLRSGQ